MFLPVSDCLDVESLFATSPLNAANTVLLFRTKIHQMLHKMLLENSECRTWEPTRCVFNPRKIHKYLQANRETRPTVENVCFYRKQNKFTNTPSQFARPGLLESKINPKLLSHAVRHPSHQTVQVPLELRAHPPLLHEKDRRPATH